MSQTKIVSRLSRYSFMSLPAKKLRVVCRKSATSFGEDQVIEAAVAAVLEDFPQAGQGYFFLQMLDKAGALKFEITLIFSYLYTHIS